MKRRTFLYTLFALTAHSTRAEAADAAPSPHAALMEASGLNAQFGRYADLIAGQFQSQLQAMGVDKARTTQLTTAFRKRFEESVFLPALRGHLEANLDPSDVQAALIWLNTADGQTITAAEIASLNEDSRREFTAYRKQLATVPTQRVTQVALLQELLGSVATELAFQTKLVGALDYASLLLHEPTTVTTPSQLEEEARIRLEGARKEIARHSLDFALFRYRTISDEPLKRYQDFLRTAPGNRYQSAVDASIQQALAQCYTRFHADIRSALTAP